ncbi:MAG: class I SAM-dependent methyltransferase [Clostridia bacterium]|nr:class I SAM-dependent methyltransferase [Clostridia bacterium]MDY5554769.1 class I SAM-dependent methyltransferase [Blautia sp.]
MYDKIGNVVLNYDFYTGEDQYCDGTIEDELLTMVTEEQDVISILKKDNRWPVLYHLSPVRQNIVEWYPLDKNMEVLEVGSGCGAVTGALCRKAGKVTCIELSQKRSLINANRNRDFSNLEIIVGNFNDVKLDKKFDCITLIGVLEYARYYTDTGNPFVDFLKNIRKMLKPHGVIMVAIENKYGLKYFAGAREDHTGVYFDGIQGYKATDSKVYTFSKSQLENVLKEAGYQKQKFYYPFPDYKFPTEIFSDEYLPKPEDLACSKETYDSSRRFLFDETAAFQEVVRSGEFPVFSNSYLVVAEQE